jgi:RHS repeat-associated protein
MPFCRSRSGSCICGSNCHEPASTGGVDAGEYVFTYDANGNVAQVLDLSAGSAPAAIVAHYEYDPYGGVVNDLSGCTYAEANPIRFSTKYHDAETGLGYWGYRYYSARLGRWISPDPLGEEGGLNLKVSFLNDPINWIDALGGSPRRPGEKPDEAERRPAKPYGTCTDCETPCKQAGLYGQALCEGGKPCWCVCANNIRSAPWLEREHHGLAVANDAIVRCTEVHERTHAAKFDHCKPAGHDDPSDECRASTASTDCMAGALASCVAMTDVSHAEGCLRRMDYWFQKYETCRAYSDEAPCPSAERDACREAQERYREARRKADRELTQRRKDDAEQRREGRRGE